MSDRPDEDGDELRARVRLSVDPPAAAPRPPRRKRVLGELLRSGLGDLKRVDFRKAVSNTCYGLLFALAFSAVLQRFELLDFFDGEMVRLVAAHRSLLDPTQVDDKHISIRQFEVSADLRVRHFEQRDGVSRIEIDRVGGVAPIDRGKLADTLYALACRLDALPKDAKRPGVVAIDVDVAPLAGGATTTKQIDRMHLALNELRRHAHVVAIALPRDMRDMRDPTGSALRNEFMARHCTTLAGSSGAACNASGGLFFASPRIFHRTRDVAIEFPTLWSDEVTAGQVQYLDPSLRAPWWPSLGTMVYQLHSWRRGVGADPEDKVWRSLTSYCEQSRRAPSGGPIAEDRLSELDADRVVENYRAQRFNWRLLDDPRLSYSPIESEEAFGRFAAPDAPAAPAAPDAQGRCEALPPGHGAGTAALPDRLLQADVIMVSVDGGARHDKFEIAGIASGPVSGATLHALQAMSLDQPVSAARSFWGGLLVDAVFALSFIGLWALAWTGIRPWRRRMPVVGAWVAILTPLVIGWALLNGAVFAAARAADHDLFINPAYIALGLVLDVYARGWREANRAPKEVEAYRSSYFGLLAARDALYSGFGDRVSGVDVDVRTRPGQLQASARLSLSRFGAAALADALLSAVLRVAVLVAGLTCLLIDASKKGAFG